MVLSQDASRYVDWMDPALMPAMPSGNYTHIHRDVLPALRERGVTDGQIQTMLVHAGRQPRRCFENGSPY